ncbi:predicted protein [Micromonas commoda]|uniref:Uncharacterized protein n=1 Tax=Micromonas commoda (strain RCC299 / NOUM17 / CCMP2709) TaxID=296587 RepID=C1E5M2_MICCC|nr:predicted protein [Micromonas commoda]ACO63658.1 predicted protein [Micromonas commoda]|eukprot:XP_002502400.1 predicted protein [Micromonas commoda]
MTPDPDTLAKQREQLAKRRALRASIPEEAALEAAAAATAAGSPAVSSRGSSEGAAIAEAAAAMAAGDPTHPATLFASFSARDAGERAASSRAAAAAAAYHQADEDAHRLAVAVVDPVSAPVSDVAAQTDPPPPAPPRVVPIHDPPTVDVFAAVVLGLLVVGVVACACVFPAQGARDARGDARRWETTLAAWSIANDLPRVASLEGFYAGAAKGARGIEAYLPPTETRDEDGRTNG